MELFCSLQVKETQVNEFQLWRGIMYEDKSKEAAMLFKIWTWTQQKK